MLYEHIYEGTHMIKRHDINFVFGIKQIILTCFDLRYTARFRIKIAIIEIFHNLGAKAESG